MTLGKSVPLSEQDLARLRELITGYCGLDGSVQTDSALQQAVSQRLAAHHLDNIVDYWSLLQRRPGGASPSPAHGPQAQAMMIGPMTAPANGEISSLVRLLTNKETFFFREMHHFDVLREHLLPELLCANPRPLRVWSAGCATGEESYSLAITLLECQARYGKPAAQVIATDIDAIALEKARQGRYDARSVRQVPEVLRQRYFSFDGQTYQILPAVADLVTFQMDNLAEDCYTVPVPLPATEQRTGLTNLDVIFCRNVTIYFDAEARDRLNARLADSLREGGYLFVASAETMGHNRGRLELISIGNTFLFQKGRSGLRDRQSPPSYPRRVPSQQDRPLPSAQSSAIAVGAETAVPPPVGAPLPGRPPAKDPENMAFASVPSPRPSVVPSRAPGAGPSRAPETPPRKRYSAGRASSFEPVHYLQRAQEAFQRHDFDAALHELDRIPAGPLVWLEVYRLRGAIFLQQERLAEAESTCQYLLAHDPWHADAHFLLGLIFRQQGQITLSVQSLKQAIYLQPSHRHAHFYLAETYRTLGLRDEARSEYENTLNVLRVARLPQHSPPADAVGRPAQSAGTGATEPAFARHGSTINLVGLEDDLLRQACEVNLRKLQGGGDFADHGPPAGGFAGHGPPADDSAGQSRQEQVGGTLGRRPGHPLI